MQGSKTSSAGKKADRTTPDRLTVAPARRPFDGDPVSWLIGEAVARLHAEDEQGRNGYRRAVELLARLDSAKAFGAVLKAVPRDDVPLRWSLLYLLAETGDLRAADLFAKVAAEPIRVKRHPTACETAYDGELLVRVRAIRGLAQLAARDRALVERLYEVLERQTAPSLRIEAVKGILAADAGEAKRLKKALPKELHFALTLEIVDPKSLSAEVDAGAVESKPPPPGLDRTRYPVIAGREGGRGG